MNINLGSRIKLSSWLKTSTNKKKRFDRKTNLRFVFVCETRQDQSTTTTTTTTTTTSKSICNVTKRQWDRQIRQTDEQRTENRSKIIIEKKHVKQIKNHQQDTRNRSKIIIIEKEKQHENRNHEIYKIPELKFENWFVASYIVKQDDLNNVIYK